MGPILNAGWHPLGSIYLISVVVSGVFGQYISFDIAIELK